MFLISAGADKKAEAGAGSATEFQFVSVPLFALNPLDLLLQGCPNHTFQIGFYIQAQPAVFCKERNYWKSHKSTLHEAQSYFIVQKWSALPPGLVS